MTFWGQLPLRSKLTAITAALLVGALAISSSAAVTLLRSSLVGQLDDQIADAAQPLTTSALTPWESYQGSAVRPTDYYFAIWDTSGRSLVDSAPTTAEQSTPALPSFDHVRALAHGNRFATLASTGGSVSRWRVGAFPIRESGSNQDLGYAVVALPMTAIDRTIGMMTRTVVIVGTLVVLLVGILGSVAVERTLRDLRRMEQTAGAVAGGDLSQRVAVRSPRTEVGKLGTSFNAMVATLEESFAEREAAQERMRRFVADASHELRTPLASIRGYGELYRMGAVPQAEVAPTMARIESEATRMGLLVNDLLALARLDERRALDVTEVDLRRLAQDTLADLGALDPSRPSALTAPNPVLARVDANRIRQVLMNLVGNAVQHTPAGTPVEIEVHGGEGTAVIKVRDHGPGIPPEESAKIFQRFYRLDSSRNRASGGTGLGLAIVATIVAAHGGTVHHEPTPGGGATIVVTLPLEPPAPGAG